AVATFHVQNFVVLDVIGQLATDTTIWTDRRDFLVRYGQRDVARRHQCAGRTCLYAFAATDTGGGAHRVVHIEYDFCLVTAESQADHIIDLLVATGAHATGTLNARIEVDRDGGMRRILLDLFARFETGFSDGKLAGPLIDFIVTRVVGFRHVGQQEFQHHFLRCNGALAVRDDFHSGSRITTA